SCALGNILARVMNDHDVRASRVANAIDILDEGSHVDGTVFVTTRHHPRESIDDDQLERRASSDLFRKLDDALGVGIRMKQIKACTPQGEWNVNNTTRLPETDDAVGDAVAAFCSEIEDSAAGNTLLTPLLIDRYMIGDIEGEEGLARV